MNQSDKFGELTDDVEDLLGKLGDVKSPDVQALRDRLRQSIATTKTAITDARAKAAEAIKGTAVATDDFVHDSPWVAVGIAAGVAAGIGFLVGRLSVSSNRWWQS